MVAPSSVGRGSEGQPNKAEQACRTGPESMPAPGVRRPHPSPPAPSPRQRAGTGSHPGPTPRGCPQAPASTWSAAGGQGHEYTQGERCSKSRGERAPRNQIKQGGTIPRSPARRLASLAPRQRPPARHLYLAHELQVASKHAGDQRLRVALPHHSQLGQAVQQRAEGGLVACRCAGWQAASRWLWRGAGELGSSQCTGACRAADILVPSSTNQHPPVP